MSETVKVCGHVNMVSLSLSICSVVLMQGFLMEFLCLLAVKVPKLEKHMNNTSAFRVCFFRLKGSMAGGVGVGVERHTGLFSSTNYIYNPFCFYLVCRLLFHPYRISC